MGKHVKNTDIAPGNTQRNTILHDPLWRESSNAGVCSSNLFAIVSPTVIKYKACCTYSLSHFEEYQNGTKRVID